MGQSPPERGAVQDIRPQVTALLAAPQQQQQQQAQAQQALLTVDVPLMILQRIPELCWAADEHAHALRVMSRGVLCPESANCALVENILAGRLSFAIGSRVVNLRVRIYGSSCSSIAKHACLSAAIY